MAEVNLARDESHNFLRLGGPTSRALKQHTINVDLKVGHREIEGVSRVVSFVLIVVIQRS